jgi:hypothetical protein
MDLITYTPTAEGVTVKLGKASAASALELLDLLDLDAFSMEDSAREELAEVRFALQTAFGSA